MALVPVMIGPLTLFNAPSATGHPNAGRLDQPVKWGAGDGDPASPWEELFQLRTKPNTIKWNLGDERTEVETGQSIYPIGEVREKGMIQISGECFDLRMATIARLMGLTVATQAAGGGHAAYDTLQLEQGHHVPTRAVMLVGQSPNIATKNRAMNLYIPYATLKGPDEIDGNETEPSSYSFMLKAVKAPGVQIATIYSE